MGKGRPRNSEMSASAVLTAAAVVVLVMVAAYFAWRAWQARQQREAPPAAPPPPVATSMMGAHAFGGLPRTVASDVPLKILENKGYVAGYSEVRRSPLFVCYRVKADGRLTVGSRSQIQFRPDPRVNPQVTREDFTRSGFDRGHMAPNYAIAACYGAAAQEETFLMTNICPQTPVLNQDVWNDLERKETAAYTARFGDVWVTCGPIFDAAPRTIGRNNVQVPVAFYKILVETKSGSARVMAVIMPQDVAKDDAGKLEKFLVTVREIEGRTGLDFFAELPREEQDRLETMKEAKAW